jgi:hypothetical protein
VPGLNVTTKRPHPRRCWRYPCRCCFTLGPPSNHNHPLYSSCSNRYAEGLTSSLHLSHAVCQKSSLQPKEREMCLQRTNPLFAGVKWVAWPRSAKKKLLTNPLGTDLEGIRQLFYIPRMTSVDHRICMCAFLSQS